MANLTEMKSKEDRLSSLSNTILIQILSHLPISRAAKTSVLSRRWRNLWKGVTTFNFQTLGIKFEIVHSILLHLTSLNIRVFDYSFRQIVYRCGQFTVAESCFLHLIRRQIEVIKLISSSYLPVPNCLFTCESLVVLDLNGHLHWKLELDEDNNLPVNGGIIHLPNLKKLRLRLTDYDYCLLRTLLKFCPLLEDLCLLLDLSHDELILDIVAPNLKSLSIEMLVPALWSDVVIDAPKLSKLKILDPCSYYRFRSIPTSLVEASINFRCLQDVKWYPVDHEYVDWTVDDHARATSKFIRGMSSVSSFELQCLGNMHAFLCSTDDGVMPVFHCVTFLKTALDNALGWRNLLCSLHCFPNLKHLGLKMDNFHFRGYTKWCEPIVLPICLLSKLKRITMKNVINIDFATKLVEFILNHANVLDELCIYMSTIAFSKEIQLWSEYKFCEDVFKLPRCSENCKIVFSGVYINTSSSIFFEKGPFNCQIRCSKELVDDNYFRRW